MEFEVDELLLCGRSEGSAMNNNACQNGESKHDACHDFVSEVHVPRKPSVRLRATKERADCKRHQNTSDRIKECLQPVVIISGLVGCRSEREIVPVSPKESE